MKVERIELERTETRTWEMYVSDNTIHNLANQPEFVAPFYPDKDNYTPHPVTITYTTTAKVPGVRIDLDAVDAECLADFVQNSANGCMRELARLIRPLVTPSPSVTPSVMRGIEQAARGEFAESPVGDDVPLLDTQGREWVNQDRTTVGIRQYVIWKHSHGWSAAVEHNGDTDFPFGTAYPTAHAAALACEAHAKGGA